MSSKQRLFIASDHAGFDLKTDLIKFLTKSDYEIEDLGCNSAEISVNYPDFANHLAVKLASESLKNLDSLSPQSVLNQNSFSSNCSKKSDSEKPSNVFGILICGSGIGISIAANRHKHIRAALCANSELAKLARAHNNANVLCLGARFTNFNLACEIAETFFKTKFEGGRHQARVAALSDQLF